MLNLRKIYPVFGLLLICCCFPVQSAPTVGDYGALPTTQMIAISPNGELIAYRKVAANKRSCSH